MLQFGDVAKNEHAPLAKIRVLLLRLSDLLLCDCGWCEGRGVREGCEGRKGRGWRVSWAGTRAGRDERESERHRETKSKNKNKGKSKNEEKNKNIPDRNAS